MARHLTLGGFQESVKVLGQGVEFNLTLTEEKQYIDFAHKDGVRIAARTRETRDGNTLFQVLDSQQQETFEKNVEIFRANHPYSLVMPCLVCGRPTNMLATQRCDNCWEVESRIGTYLQSAVGEENIRLKLRELNIGEGDWQAEELAPGIWQVWRTPSFKFTVITVGKRAGEISPNVSRELRINIASVVRDKMRAGLELAKVIRDAY